MTDPPSSHDAAEAVDPTAATGAASAASAAGAAGAAGADDAAGAALARVRAVAAAKGLHPGRRPRVRRTGAVTGQGVRPGSAGSRDPARLGDQVDALVADRGWKVDVNVGAVMGRWPAIVGPEVAQHSHPVTFEAGVLTVRTDSTAWATQLRMLSASLMERLAVEAGAGTVSELRIVGPSAPSWSRGPRRTSDGRGPRDTYG